MIQKIEKWRIQELSKVLKHLAGMLREGKNREWANVFEHYSHEAGYIVQRKKFDLHMLKKLVLNIKNCFDRMSSLHALVLSHESSKAKENLNREFLQTKAHLFQMLNDIENKCVERIH
jgi:hypothetical protein